MSAALLPNQLSNALLQVRIAWGANLSADSSLWSYTDATTDVVQANGGGVTISPMGRSNETTTAQPAGCSFRVKNQTGAYTPYNPSSSHYPNVRLGTPIQVRVSLNGGSTWSVRFQGEASAWSPGWDAQGKFAYVSVTASGITRRLGSGNKPLRSALARSILGTTSATLRQYWPCEDGTTSAQIASAFPAGPPMSLTFVGGLGPGMAALNPTTLDPAWLQAGLPPYGTLPLPQMSNGSGIQVSFPPGNPSAWTVQFGVWIDPAEVSTDTNIRVLAEWQTPGGTFVRWRMIADHSVATFGTYLVAYKPDGTSSQVSAAGQGFSRWDEIRVEAVQSGGNINVFWAVNGLTRSGTFTGTLAGVAGFVGNPDQYASARNFTVGHVRVWDQAGVPDYQPGPPSPTNNLSAWYGHLGETATDRLTRLCAEEGISLTLMGTSTTTMGAQSIDTLMNLLRECGAADLGYLLDGMGPGLTYIARSQLYNQTAQVTINANSGQVPASPGPQPTNDDQRLVNRVTVTRTNGSFVIAEDEGGPLGTAAIGVRDSRSVVNTATDGQLGNIGAWLIHLGTVEGMRYPQVVINLAAAPELASSWVQAVPTDRIDLTNLSSRLTQHPLGDVSLLAEGWTEFLSSRSWAVVVNCSSFQPWQVDALNTTFKLEMAGQTLQSSLAPGATSLSLATAAGNQLFTTSAAYPADFPLDLNVAGWQIHVTAATGAASPQTLTITASPNTATIPSTTPVTLWRPAALAL